MNIVYPRLELPHAHTPAQDVFAYWITEREAIRQKKEARQPVPWTDDPILRDYRFCNVRREDDKVTRWIADHIRRPYEDNPNLWFMLCVARIINLPDTLQELMDADLWPVDEWKPDQAAAVLEARKARGDQIETSAYMIRAESNRKAKWYDWSKQRYICEIVLGRLWPRRDQFHSLFPDAGLQLVHGWMKTNYAWADFMSYQAIVDMRFTPILDDAFDLDRWAAAGPGTIRGLNRLAGRDIDFRLKQDRALKEMKALYPELCAGYERVSPGRFLDFSDVPNILCEVDKYLRVLNGEGKPRAKYRPNG